MITKSHRTILLAVCCSMSLCVLGQVPESPTRNLTPAAASIQRYGSIPVNLNTGTPNIYIALDTLREGKLSVPVGLSYHSGGIKPAEHAGPTGLGWSLICGGAITRELHGEPDERKFLNVEGYFHTREWVKSLAQSPYAIPDKLQELINASTVSPDGEPDRFNFNFCGISGYFILDADGNWRVHSEQQIRVEEVTTSDLSEIDATLYTGTIYTNSKVINSITLADGNGTRYKFGLDGTDLSQNIRTQKLPEWQTTAWYLKEIRHLNGETITFTYLRGNYAVSFANSSRKLAIYLNGNNTPLSGDVNESYPGRLLSPVYPVKIEGTNFEVKFYYSKSTELDYTNEDYFRRLNWIPGNMPDNYEPINLKDNESASPYSLENMRKKIRWLKLDNIEFSIKDQSPYKRIIFNTSDSPATRLMLNGLKIAGSNGGINSRYAFEYVQPSLMPPYLTREVDHWGYYNAGNSTPTIHTPDETAMKYGVLKKIIYPTGGWTELEFEAHDYMTYLDAKLNVKSLASPQKAGGLRIKKISDHPGNGGTPQVRTYHYVSNYGSASPNSSGIILCEPIYSIDRQIDDFSIRESDETPLSNVLSNYSHHIGYSEVTERFPGNGFATYTFTSSLDYPDIAPFSTVAAAFAPCTSQGNCRGLLKEKKVCDEAGILLEQTKMTYELSENGPDNIIAFYSSVAGLRSGYKLQGQFEEIYTIDWALYRHRTYRLLLKQKETAIHDPLTSICKTTSTRYTYNSRDQLQKTSVKETVNGLDIENAIETLYEWENNDTFAAKQLFDHVHSILESRNSHRLKHIENAYSWIGNTYYLKTVSRLFGANRRRSIYECRTTDNRGYPTAVWTPDGLITLYGWTDDHRYHTFQSITAQGIDLKLTTDYDIHLPEGIVRTTTPDGKNTFYGYDQHQRLTRVAVGNNELLHQIRYSNASSR